MHIMQMCIQRRAIRACFLGGFWLFQASPAIAGSFADRFENLTITDAL